jgi:hypothetical protein
MVAQVTTTAFPPLRTKRSRGRMKLVVPDYARSASRLEHGDNDSDDEKQENDEEQRSQEWPGV